jgi:hypothetical protein
MAGTDMAMMSIDYWGACIDINQKQRQRQQPKGVDVYRVRLRTSLNLKGK